MPIKKEISNTLDLFPTQEYVGIIYKENKEGLYYERPEGKLYISDCISFMKSLDDKSVDMIFADPPYNIGKDKKWDVWKNMDDYIEWSERWIKEAARVLKDDGTMYICGFSEIIALCQASAMK